MTAEGQQRSLAIMYNATTAVDVDVRVTAVFRAGFRRRDHSHGVLNGWWGR